MGEFSGFSVYLNGSGRAEVGMSLPDFAEEELDIEVIELNKEYNTVIL